MNKIILLLSIMYCYSSLAGDSEGSGAQPANSSASQHHILCTAPTAALMLQNQANEYTSNAEASAMCVNVLQQEGIQGQVVRSVDDGTGEP